MSRSRRWVFVVSAALLGGAGCGEREPSVSEDASSSSGDDSSGDDGWPGPISTVTSAGHGDPSTGGSASGGASNGTGEEGTGAPIDAAPTITLTLNGEAAPAPIAKAGSQTIGAEVADDHGLALLEIFVGDDDAPFAAIPLAGSTWEQVEVPLPIYGDDQNGALPVRAVIHDDADQSTASATVELVVKVPGGGSPIWESVSAGKFASKALAVAVDSIGDVIAVGSEDTTGDGHRSRMKIRKYHGESGALLWERSVPTQAEVPSPPGNNVARGVAVDAYDNVYVVGEVDPDGDSVSTRWVGKYTFDGILADTHVSDAWSSRGNGVAVDDAGRVFVVGYRRDVLLQHVSTIAAFDVALDPLWKDEVVVDGYVDARLYSVAVDRTGKVVAVGSTGIEMTQSSRGLVTLYSAEGERQWARVMSPFDVLPKDRLFSLVVTDDNEYVCAGRRVAYGDPRRLWHLRVNESGDEVDSHPDVVTRCGDPDFTNDTDVCGVRVAPPDRLVWSGVAYADVDDIQVMRTGRDGGTHYWMLAINGDDAGIDRGLAVTTDADGFVSAAGYETKLGAPRWWVSRRNP